MADTLAPAPVRASRRPYSSRSPSAWIRRRARRLARAYNLSRREAVKNAIIDWTHFNPGAILAGVEENGRG